MLFLYLQILLFINDAGIKSSRTSTAENTTPPWVSIHAVCGQLDQGHPFRLYQNVSSCCSFVVQPERGELRSLEPHGLKT
jgi:hypothetical protein